MTQPRVVFVCVGNSCRSQMAQGFFNHSAKERGLNLYADSAGTKPEAWVNPVAIEVMTEKGIDISHHTSNGIMPEQTLDYDIVITMGCSYQDVCPANFVGMHADWSIDDPIHQPHEFFREKRDEIEAKVLDLMMYIEH
jgi:protein-tyrosine-phosphatase